MIREMIFVAKTKTLAFIGQRPDTLPWGLNEEHPSCRSLILVIRSRLAGLIENENVRHFASGMSMGIDLICAEIVLELKERYADITLEAAIPNGEQDLLWPLKYRERYREVLRRCDHIYVVSEESADDCFERRNRYMVDKCDLVLAVWDGNPGGAEDKIAYAKKENKRIISVDPFELVD